MNSAPSIASTAGDWAKGASTPPGKSRRRGARPAGMPWKAGITPVRAAQVAVWELAGLAVLATVFPLGAAGIVAIALGAVAVLFTSVRFDGLCWYQWCDVQVHHRRRHRRVTSAGAPRDPLEAVLPGLRISRHVDRAGNRIGLARVDDGWSAVVRLAPTGRMDSEALVSALRTTFDRVDIRLSGAELVTWSVTGPPAHRGAPPENVRICWLALRYLPSAAPRAALARGGAERGAARTIASAAFGLVNQLAAAGQPSAVLDEQQLRQDLLVALGADPAGLTGHSAIVVTETWRDWRAGRVRQTCFVPRKERDALTVLGRHAPQAAFTCTSYALSRTPRGEVRGATTVRIGLPAAAKQQHEPVLRPDHVAHGLGVKLFTLNGRHAHHARATLPLALND
ncbi:type VII secretion protein EccE [Solihabitans fulvus]|uniref:Type VII secretion protein EccE n=1 Tax=Solihabitans fulvus TaxID=1892852 RepID=A0A5B2XTH9_9PSEU|nr:type VII secretion protein EccE [Solihabitans fulvus]KAA2266475.1 type VII secretion protein EccE [Solihabitans fulvus]